MSRMHPLTLDPRSAGRVTRFHTWERIREQSVAEHTWNVLRILLAIWPDCPREVLVEVMFHDVGERVSGDAPYPTKAENPALKREMDRLEDAGRLAMTRWGVVAHMPLTEEAHAIFKMAEFIEMWEYALDEVALGNASCVLIRDRCHAKAAEMCNARPSDEIRSRTVSYMQRRIEHDRKHRRLHHPED